MPIDTRFEYPTHCITMSDWSAIELRGITKTLMINIYRNNCTNTFVTLLCMCMFWWGTKKHHVLRRFHSIMYVFIAVYETAIQMLKLEIFQDPALWVLENREIIRNSKVRIYRHVSHIILPWNDVFTCDFWILKFFWKRELTNVPQKLLSFAS